MTQYLLTLVDYCYHIYIKASKKMNICGFSSNKLKQINLNAQTLVSSMHGLQFLKSSQFENFHKQLPPKLEN